jgi:hypothetical protein
MLQRRPPRFSLERSRRPRAMLGMGAVLAALALAATTVFILTSGFDTSAWVVTDQPRGDLLGLDARARDLALAANSTDVKAYLDDAADALEAEGNLPRGDFDVNDAYGLAFININQACYQLIAGTIDQPGSVVPCLDSLDETVPALDQLTPAANSSINGTTTLSVRSTDNRRIDRVEFQFRVNNEFIGDPQAADRVGWSRTYTTSFNGDELANGQVDLCATTWDKAGNEGRACHSVTAVGPPAPQSPLTVTATGGINQAVVNWTPSSTPPLATGYYVYWNAANDFATASRTDQVVEPTHTETITGLDPATTYWFWVTAVNGGSVESSPPAGPATALTLPVTPTGLAATGVDGSDTTMAVSWAPVTGTVSGYHVYRNGGTTPVYSGSSTSFTDSGLTGNTTYYYTVTAYNSSGDSPQSDPATGTTAPAAPTGMTVTTSGTGYSGSYNASSGAVSYQLQLNRDVGATSALLVDSTLSGNSNTSFSATPGTKSVRYQGRVRATNAAGLRSPWTSWTPWSAWTTPLDPTGAYASVCGNGYQYCLNFNSPYGVSWLNVNRAVSDVYAMGVLQNNVPSTAVGATTYTDPTNPGSSLSGASGWGWLGFQATYQAYVCNSNGCSSGMAQALAASRWYANTAANGWGVSRLSWAYSAQYGGQESVWSTKWYHDDLSSWNAWGPGYLGMNWGPYAINWAPYGTSPGYRYDYVAQWFWFYQKFPSYGCYWFMGQSDDSNRLRLGSPAWGGGYATDLGTLLTGWDVWNAIPWPGTGQQYSTPACAWVYPGTEVGALWGHYEETGDAYFYAWWANTAGWDQWGWTLIDRNWIRWVPESVNANT